MLFQYVSKTKMAKIFHFYLPVHLLSGVEISRAFACKIPSLMEVIWYWESPRYHSSRWELNHSARSSSLALMHGLRVVASAFDCLLGPGCCEPCSESCCMSSTSSWSEAGGDGESLLCSDTGGPTPLPLPLPEAAGKEIISYFKIYIYRIQDKTYIIMLYELITSA